MLQQTLFCFPFPFVHPATIRPYHFTLSTETLIIFFISDLSPSTGGNWTVPARRLPPTTLGQSVFNSKQSLVSLGMEINSFQSYPRFLTRYIERSILSKIQIFWRMWKIHTGNWNQGSWIAVALIIIEEASLDHELFENIPFTAKLDSIAPYEDTEDLTDDLVACSSNLRSARVNHYMNQ